MGPIINALGFGYTANQVLSYITRRFPQYKNYIEKAALAGYAGNTILEYLGKEKGTKAQERSYLTEHQKIKKNLKAQKRKERGLVATGLATAGAIGLGAGIYGARAAAAAPQLIIPRPFPRPGSGAVGQTINITPNRPGGAPALPIRGAQPQIRAQPRQLTNQQPQIAQQQPIAPIAPIKPQPPAPITRPPINTPPVITPPYEHVPEKNIDLIKNIQADKRISQVVTSGLAPAAVIQVLRETLPRSKQAILNRAEGGFEQAIADFTAYKQQELLKSGSEKKRLGGLEAFKNRNKNSLLNQEAKRFEEQYQPPVPLIESQPISEEIIPANEPEPQQAAPIQQTQGAASTLQPSLYPVNPEVRNRTTSSAFSELAPKKLSEVSNLSRRNFSIPNYKYTGESETDFENRKIIFGAVNKAAEALGHGKSFLDFPINKEAIKARGGYSTAADVLRFMAGMPNIYDPLLDDSERQELNTAVVRDISTPSIAASPGERDVWGAQMTPNLVWNLLLSVEPRLGTMEKPPSVKGYKMAPGGKMGTAELRRFLTHSVYGVLSGRTISTELADKIGAISKAASSIDVIAKAAKAGSQQKMYEEMERLYKDDHAFFEMMDIELDDLLLTEEGRQKKAEKEEFNKKADTAYMAAQTRKKNKESNEEIKKPEEIMPKISQELPRQEELKFIDPQPEERHLIEHEEWIDYLRNGLEKGEVMQHQIQQALDEIRESEEVLKKYKPNSRIFKKKK